MYTSFFESSKEYNSSLNFNLILRMQSQYTLNLDSDESTSWTSGGWAKGVAGNREIGWCDTMSIFWYSVSFWCCDLCPHVLVFVSLLGLTKILVPKIFVSQHFYDRMWTSNHTKHTPHATMCIKAIDWFHSWIKSQTARDWADGEHGMAHIHPLNRCVNPLCMWPVQHFRNMWPWPTSQAPKQCEWWLPYKSLCIIYNIYVLCLLVMTATHF